MPQENDKPKVDLNRSTGNTAEALTEIANLFEYKAWDHDQNAAGAAVRASLMQSYESLIAFVPPCPTRTRALNMLLDARMLANAAISHKGRY